MRKILKMHNIFKKKENIIWLDKVGVDMHSHLIPGIDDGVKTIEESIESIKILHDMGYSHLITTPHIMPDFYPNTPEIIQAGLAKVRDALKADNIHITIDAAAEYYLDFGFYEQFDKEKILSINNKYVLIELSFLNPPQVLYETIFKIETSGFTPILAHPERYSYWINNLEVFQELKNRGVWLQVNINSFADEYGAPIRRMAEKLVKLNLVDLLGSDFHRSQHMESMIKALKNKTLQKIIDSGQLKNHLLIPE